MIFNVSQKCCLAVCDYFPGYCHHDGDDDDEDEDDGLNGWCFAWGLRPTFLNYFVL
jgi:hypothetical protein